MKRTEEGFLRGEAIVTRVGVFPYVNADGTLRHELRHPDDVLSSEAMASLSLLPITIDHPSSLVTIENSDDLVIGHTGETARPDGSNIVVPLVITSKRGLDAVAGGRKELSLGYKLELVKEDGVYDGVPYTHRQRNIRYNHLALVHSARAGRAARLNMDGVDEISVQLDQLEEEVPAMTTKVNIDGLQYDAAPEVARALDKADKTISELQTDIQKVRADSKAELDKLQARLDAAIEGQKAAETLLKAEQDGRADAIGKHVALLAKAQPLVGKDVKLDGKTPREIQVLAIKSRNKDFNDTDKSDDYVAARFDAIVEAAPPVARQLATATGGNPTPVDIRSDEAIEADAWKKSVDNFNSWRNPKQ